MRQLNLCLGRSYSFRRVALALVVLPMVYFVGWYVLSLVAWIIRIDGKTHVAGVIDFISIGVGIIIITCILFPDLGRIIISGWRRKRL